MRNIVENFDIGNNFWKYNPQMKIIFKEVYEDDKSKNKEKSSDLMWGIFLCIHPKSDFFNLPDKELILSRDIIKDKSFTWENAKPIVNKAIECCLTQGQKSLIDWNAYMKQRDEYLRNTEYYFDRYATDENGDNVYSKLGNLVTIKGTAEQLDKAWGSSKSMWKDYIEISKVINEEESQKKGKGGKNLSLSDGGKI